MDLIIDSIEQSLKGINMTEIVRGTGIATLKIILTFILLYIIKHILIKLVEAYFLGKRPSRMRFNNQARNQTLSRLTVNIIQYAYYFMLVYSILTIMGLPVGTLLASAGLISLAIGLGSKDLVADLVNGFFILLEHQFDVGDAVEINGYSGIVYSIGIRNTVIRDYNGVHHFIPNGDIGQMSNHSLDHIRLDVDLYIYADQNIDQLEIVLKEVYQEVPQEDGVILKAPDFLGVFRDAQGRLLYKVRIWVTSVDHLLVVQARYYKAFIQGLAKAGVLVPRLNQVVEVREQSVN